MLQDFYGKQPGFHISITSSYHRSVWLAVAGADLLWEKSIAGYTAACCQQNMSIAFGKLSVLDP